jgi:DNA-binding transcriptional regulator LsrR (DeoR family)
VNRSFSEFDLKAIAAAHFSSQGDKQKVVSDKLKVSQPQVSRLLKHARKRGLLIDRDPVFRVTERDRLLWEEARQRFVSDDPLVRELRRLSGGRLRRVHVIYGTEDDFFPEAARALIPLLAQVRLVGVTWGRTVRKTAEALERLSPQPLRSSPHSVEFIPLCGEPFEDRQDPLEYSSSALASLLTRIVAGPKARNPLSLAGVYAFVPQSFADQDAANIRRFLQLGKGYRAIFGDDAAPGNRITEPLVQRLDTI